MDNRLSDNSVKMLSRLAAGAGLLCIIGALVSDITGLSAGDAISFNQIAFFIVGVLLVAAGFLGRKVPGYYKSTAVFILNILVTLLVIELSSIIILKVVDNSRFTIRARKIQEGNLEATQNTPVLGKFAPYVMWRSNIECNNDSCTVNSSGYRNTMEVSSSSDAYHIYLFGGSAMWGTGVSDRETIASHLQAILNNQASCPVVISNMGQPAFNSTQGLIELVLQLRNDHIPNMVIFYDGFNDVWTAYESGLPGRLFAESDIARRLNIRQSELTLSEAAKKIFAESNFGILVSAIRAKAETENAVVTKQIFTSFGVDVDTLAQNVVGLYQDNMRIVEALSQTHGFKYTAVWQPSIWYGSKELTEYESRIYRSGIYFSSTGGDSAFYELYNKTYSLFEATLLNEENYLSYASIFDSNENTVYNDFSGVHPYGWANAVIAESLAADIKRLDPSIFTLQ